MFSYEELLSKYNILLKENKELKSQITELKTKLGMPIETEEVVVETSDTVINKYSSTTEKILLYRSLFCGREDVLREDGTAKQQKKVVISLFVKTNGLMVYVTKGNINVLFAPIVNYLPLRIKIYTNILKEKTIMEKM